MRILVTGGAGFIGSALIRRLLRTTAHEVINLDKLTYAADLEKLADLRGDPRYCFEQADIGDRSALRRIFAQHQPDAVMHLAAETHVDRSIDGPAAFIAANIDGTFTLLEAAREYWRHLPPARQGAFRLHHISTDEVFGTLGPSGCFTETSPYAPRSPYAASKASSDMLVRTWLHTFGLPTVVSNSSNTYGPYQFPEKLIPAVIMAALARQPITVYGTGENVRDWLYVDDHAEALIAVFERGRIGETYLIGGCSEATNIDLVRRICCLLDDFRPDDTPHEQLIAFVPDRPGHDFRYALDQTKIQRELGWFPTIDLPDGIRQTVLWYLDNQGWCRSKIARVQKPGHLA